jgi:hypothetical protein
VLGILIVVSAEKRLTVPKGLYERIFECRLLELSPFCQGQVHIGNSSGGKVK